MVNTKQENAKAAADVVKRPGLFGRMFPRSRLSAEKDIPDPRIVSSLMRVMEPDPIDKKKLEALENPSVPAGYTFLGQFIVHDLTFDPTSIEERVRDPQAQVNFRTPMLDLDSLYGSGPEGMPWLYDPDHYGSFLLHRDDDPYDVARNRRGRALMADPRNDENLIIAQIHVAFLKLHNSIMKRLDDKAYLPPEERFHEARRLVILLYQYVVWYDYLPKICVTEVLDYFERGGKPLFFLYEKQSPYKEPYLPVEFNAVLRFGHALLKPRYWLNVNFEGEFGAKEIRKNLRGGGRPVTANQRIDWAYFFPEEGVQDDGRAQPSRRIAPYISSRAGDLPAEALRPSGRNITTLSERDLRRALNWGVPSGNDVSDLMDKVLRKKNGRAKSILEVLDLVRDERRILPDWEIWPDQVAADPVRKKDTPLLYHVLREAEETQNGGERLGVHGSWIIAEVIHGMLRFSKKESSGRNGSGCAAQPRKLFLDDGTIWKPKLEPCLQEFLGDMKCITMNHLLRLVDTRKPFQPVKYPQT